MSVEPEIEEVQFTADLIIETTQYVLNKCKNNPTIVNLTIIEAIEIATAAVTSELQAEYLSQLDERLRTNAIEVDKRLSNIAGAVAYTAQD